MHYNYQSKDLVLGLYSIFYLSESHIAKTQQYKKFLHYYHFKITFLPTESETIRIISSASVISSGLYRECPVWHWRTKGRVISFFNTAKINTLQRTKNHKCVHITHLWYSIKYRINYEICVNFLKNFLLSSSQNDCAKETYL